MDRKVLEFIAALWRRNVQNCCLDCYTQFRLAYGGRYLEYIPPVFERITRPAPPEVLGAVASALLDTGISFEEACEWLRAVSWHTSPSEERPVITEAMLRAGEWHPSGCVQVRDIVTKLRERFPDPS